jgi:hypothetical protein
MSEDNPGRSTPSGVKRQLRREAGFGCCKCGDPILQYHHIVEFWKERHFRAEDMMVLCPKHHDQATKGAMPEAEQRAYKANPHNISLGLAHGKLEIKQDYCAADFGGLTILNEGPFLMIGNAEVLGMNVGESNIELSIKLFGESDELLVEIEKNEWVSGDPLPWDIEADWQRLTIRERKRKINLALDATKIPMRVRGEFWNKGHKISVTDSGLKFDGETIHMELANLAVVGGWWYVDGENLAYFSSTHGGRSSLISCPNPRERLYKAKAAWDRLKQEPAAPSH